MRLPQRHALFSAPEGVDDAEKTLKFLNPSRYISVGLTVNATSMPNCNDINVSPGIVDRIYDPIVSNPNTP